MDFCVTCRYYVPTDNSIGECRRHSPVLVNTSTSHNWSVRAMYPPTSAAGGCGDHEARTKEEEDSFSDCRKAYKRTEGFIHYL